MGLWPGQPPAVLADDSSPGSAPPGQHSVRVSVLVGPLTAAKDGWVIAHWERAEGMPRYTLAHAGPASPLPLAGLPWPAPHGRLFVTVSEALGTAASAGARVDLWQRTGPRWSRLLHYEAPAGLHLRFKAWRADGSALRLAWATDPAGCSQANSSPASGELQLRDGPYGWDFLPSPPQPCGP